MDCGHRLHRSGMGDTLPATRRSNRKLLDNGCDHNVRVARDRYRQFNRQSLTILTAVEKFQAFSLYLPPSENGNRHR